MPKSSSAAHFAAGEMEEERVRVFRTRVVFDDSCLLSNSQLSDGLRCFWILLKPGIATFADLASYLRETFALCNRVILSIDDFTLPPFESTCIIKDKDIIRVTQKDAKSKNEHKSCDSQNLVRDHQIARALGCALSNYCMEDGTSKKKLQGEEYNVEENLVCHVENAVHRGNSTCDIELPKQKRELSHELQDSKRKKQKLNCTEKPVTCTEVIQDMHLRQNGTFSNVSVGSKMGLHAKDNAHDGGLSDAQAGLSVNLCVQKPSGSMRGQERQQPEGVDHGHESEPQSAFYVTKECAPSCGANRKISQNQLTKQHQQHHLKKANQSQATEKNFKGENDGCDSRKKTSGLYIVNSACSDGNSPDKKAKPSNQKIDFATLFPLTRPPLKGDVLAYRYVESSSSGYPELSSPHVGKVSVFNYKSLEIVLVPVPEFEVFEENPNISMSQQKGSLYKEDGSLEIKLSALIDVRLLKAHDSKDLACLPEGTVYRAKKDNWEAALANSHWNQSDAHHADESIGWGDWMPDSCINAATRPLREFNPTLGGKENGAKSYRNERVSASRLSGASPAEVLFWETLLSKGLYGKG